MDHPIIYTRREIPKIIPDSVHRQNKFSLYERLCIALANDEKSYFMSLIKDPGFGEVRDSFTVDNIFSYDALEIAMAVLSGETKGLIDTEDELKDGMTPLHLATIHCAPRLTEYLLQIGGKVDAVCDNKKFNLEAATPIGLSTYIIYTGEKETLFELLFYICFHNRRRMEIIRMLVQSGQNSWAMEAFINYVQNGKLPELTALFLATPELFLKYPESDELSLLSKLYLVLNSLEHKTHIVKQLLLLLDVFALVGRELAAYIRLEEYAPKSRTTENVEQSMLEIVFFLREAAALKHGHYYLDYYLRFFEDENSNSDLLDCADDDDVRQDWYNWTSKLVKNDVLYFLPYLLRRPGFKRPEIYRLIPTLKAYDEDTLTRAIANKLSSTSALHEDSVKDKRREAAEREEKSKNVI